MMDLCLLLQWQYPELSLRRVGKATGNTKMEYRKPEIPPPLYNSFPLSCLSLIYDRSKLNKFNGSRVVNKSSSYSFNREILEDGT